MGRFDTVGANNLNTISSTALSELIKEGDVYFLARTDLAIADTATVEYLIQTSSSDVAIVGEVTTSANATIDTFEDTTFSAAGTAQTLFNCNRNSTKTSSVTVTKTPTITDDGALLTDNFINGGQKNQAFGGASGSTIPLVLDQDSTYLIRATNVGGSSAAISVSLTILELP